MSDKIMLVANNAAVDALILTKADAIEGIRRTHGFSLNQLATIGDEVGDIPMLEIPGLGAVATVANAQQRVIDFVSAKENGYVSPLSVFDGFMDFYTRCKQDGSKLIITDKDGVLKEGANLQWGPLYADLAMQMGFSGNPFCTILTGSALSQNDTFRFHYGLDERLVHNKAVKENPYLLLVENGAIHVNVITGETENYCHRLNPELLETVKGPFELEVAKRLEEEILPEFNLSMSYDYADQAGKVYHIREKQAGVCFNIPRTDCQGRPFRNTPEAEELREREVALMAEVAHSCGLEYTLL